MTPEQLDRFSSDQELMFLTEQLQEAKTLKDKLFPLRNESAIAMLRYEVALKGWTKLRIAFEDKLSEIMA